MPKQTKQDVQQLLLDKIAELSKQVAELKQQQATQPARASRKRERGEARPDVFYVLLGVPSQGLSPQALACARILATAADVNHIPESEAMELIEAGKQSGRLRTSQDSWHIFQYYRPQLIAGDYLRMITNQ